MAAGQRNVVFTGTGRSGPQHPLQEVQVGLQRSGSCRPAENDTHCLLRQHCLKRDQYIWNLMETWNRVEEEFRKNSGIGSHRGKEQADPVLGPLAPCVCIKPHQEPNGMEQKLSEFRFGERRGSLSPLLESSQSGSPVCPDSFLLLDVDPRAPDGPLREDLSKNERGR